MAHCPIPRAGRLPCHMPAAGCSHWGGKDGIIPACPMPVGMHATPTQLRPTAAPAGFTLPRLGGCGEATCHPLCRAGRLLHRVGGRRRGTPGGMVGAPVPVATAGAGDASAPGGILSTLPPWLVDWAADMATMFTTIAVLLGTGILGLPVKLVDCGFSPFALIFSVTALMQVGVVLVQTETVAITVATAAARGKGGVTWDLATLGRSYLSQPHWVPYFAAVMLNFMTILISYALAASQSIAQLLDLDVGAVITPFVVVCATVIVVAHRVLQPIVSVLTAVKVMLLLFIIGVVGVVSRDVALVPTSSWADILEPFLIGTVALGGLASMLPVMFPPATITSHTPGGRRRLVRFQVAMIAGVAVCYALNMLWAAFVLGIVPQTQAEAVALDLPASLQQARAEGQIAVKPVTRIIDERFPQYGWVATTVKAFITLSLTVSFNTLGMGTKHTLDGVAMALLMWWVNRRKGGRIQRSRHAGSARAGDADTGASAHVITGSCDEAGAGVQGRGGVGGGAHAPGAGSASATRLSGGVGTLLPAAGRSNETASLLPASTTGTAGHELDVVTPVGGGGGGAWLAHRPPQSRWRSFLRASCTRDLPLYLALYVVTFGIAWLVAWLNPAGFIVVLESFTSLALNLGGGVYVVMMNAAARDVVDNDTAAALAQPFRKDSDDVVSGRAGAAEGHGGEGHAVPSPVRLSHALNPLLRSTLVYNAVTAFMFVTFAAAVAFDAYYSAAEFTLWQNATMFAVMVGVVLWEGCILPYMQHRWSCGGGKRLGPTGGRPDPTRARVQGVWAVLHPPPATRRCITSILLCIATVVSYLVLPQDSKLRESMALVVVVMPAITVYHIIPAMLTAMPADLRAGFTRTVFWAGEVVACSGTIASIVVCVQRGVLPAVPMYVVALAWLVVQGGASQYLHQWSRRHDASDRVSAWTPRTQPILSGWGSREGGPGASTTEVGAPRRRSASDDDRGDDRAGMYLDSGDTTAVSDMEDGVDGGRDGEDEHMGIRAPIQASWRPGTTLALGGS